MQVWFKSINYYSSIIKVVFIFIGNIEIEILKVLILFESYEFINRS